MKNTAHTKIAIGVGVFVAALSLTIIGHSLYKSTNVPLDNHAKTIKPGDITSSRLTYALTNQKPAVDVEVEVSLAYAEASTKGFTEAGNGMLSLSKDAKFEEAKFIALLDAIDTQQKARYVVKKIHQSWNERTGFGNYRVLRHKDSSTWDYLRMASYMDERLYAKLADMLPSETFSQDMEHAAELSRIAKTERSVEAVLYLHRIFHDLDYWAFKDGSKGGDFWGVTETVKSDAADHSKELQKFIAKHKP